MQGLKKVILLFALSNCLMGCEENRGSIFPTEDAGEDTMVAEELDVLDTIDTIEDVAEVKEVPDVVEEQGEDGEDAYEGECVQDLSDLTQAEVYERIYFQEYPVVIYNYIDRCGWCNYYAPEYEEVCRWREADLVFYKVNVNKVPMEFDVRAYPTTFFFCNGDEPEFYQRGYMSAEELDYIVDVFLGSCDL